MELWGWEEKGELEKIIMLDYVDYRWIFKLDVCTPRCVIMRELDRLKGCLTQRGLRTRKYKEKIKFGNTGNLVRKCWEEKQSYLER